MNRSTNDDYAVPMNEIYQPMNTTIHARDHRGSAIDRLCIVCGSKSVGMNFGVLTCAPCKAFFRRNARRKELLELPCRHRDLSMLMKTNVPWNERTARYLQIRRCSSCRLRRCFEMGMREELVRSEAENERHKQLVDINRKRREMFKQQLLEIQQLSFPPIISNNSEFSDKIDWRHLSNIVYAYDTCCLKTFTQQREEMFFGNSLQISDGNPTTLIMSVVLAVSSFLKSLPAFYSLPRSTRNFLCKTNTRPLIFPTIHELNQSCYSEPWQVVAYELSWQSVCGRQLYTDFNQVIRSAQKFWISDPVVIRLWVITLFFSTPLHYHDEGPLLTPILKKKAAVRQTQNAYIGLLWKYLLHRYGNDGAVRIYSNLVFVYLKMQSIGFDIYMYLKDKRELQPTHETINKLVTLDIHENAKKTIEVQAF